MTTLQELRRIAEQKNIPVDSFPLCKREALSIMDEAGSCYIAIDPNKLKNETDARNKLAHELGHCVTGSFYSSYTAVDSRQRHENRADKWAIRKLITANELDEAVASGCTEIWELAERFGVSEEFMKKTVCLYVHGNVAASLYF